MKSKNQELFIK